MREGKKADIDILWQQVTISERFSSVLYPINVPRLLEQLPNIGYVVPDLVLKGTLEQGKPVATMGNTELLINPENKTIGVKDNDPEKAATAFQQLRGFYLDRLDPSPLEVQYVEFIGIGWITSKQNPLKVFSHIWRESKLLQKVGLILGKDVANFGVQICPKDQDPNNPTWFHILVQPSPVSATNEYSVQWIWREPNSEDLFKKYAKVTDTLRTVISTLEGT